MKSGTDRKESVDHINVPNNNAEDDDLKPFKLTILPLKELSQYEDSMNNG